MFQSYPSSATTLHFEFYAEVVADGVERGSNMKTVGGLTKSSANTVTVIHVEHVEWLNKSPAQLMEELIEVYHVPLDKQMQLFTHIRLAHAFSDYRRRLQCVQARLQALSVLIYCNALADAAPSLLYAGNGRYWNGFCHESGGLRFNWTMQVCWKNWWTFWNWPNRS